VQWSGRSSIDVPIGLDRFCSPFLLTVGGEPAVVRSPWKDGVLPAGNELESARNLMDRGLLVQALYKKRCAWAVMRRLQLTYPSALTVYHAKFTTRFPRSHTSNVLKRMASSTLQRAGMRKWPAGCFVRLHSGIATSFSSQTSRAASMQHDHTSNPRALPSETSNKSKRRLHRFYDEFIHKRVRP
jgi:hypothetical protein